MKVSINKIWYKVQRYDKQSRMFVLESGGKIKLSDVDDVLVSGVDFSKLFQNKKQKQID